MTGQQFKTLVREAWRYGLVSLAALVLDAGLLVVLVEGCHWHYLLAGGVSFVAGMSLAYLLSITWVFQHRARTGWREEILIFGLVGIAGLGINELVLWAGTGWLEFHYLFSKAGAAGASFTFNFGLRKWLLFNPGNLQTQSANSKSR